MTRNRWIERLYLLAAVFAVAFVIVDLVRGRTGSAASEGVIAVAMAALFVTFRRTRLRGESGGYLDDDPNMLPRGQHGPTADYGD
jgi:hypothetical protein